MPCTASPPCVSVCGAASYDVVADDVPDDCDDCDCPHAVANGVSVTVNAAAAANLKTGVVRMVPPLPGLLCW